MNVDNTSKEMSNIRHHLSDINRLLSVENMQIEKLRETLNKLDSESNEISLHRVKRFKFRFLIIFLFTIMFGVYAVNTATTITMSYTEPYFYIILIGSLVWMFLLKYHFSENLEYKSEAFNDLKDLILEKERNIEILENMKDSVNYLINLKGG